jgi:hypothetical protein
MASGNGFILVVLPDLLDRLAEQETRFIAALGERDEEKAQDL